MNKRAKKRKAASSSREVFAKSIDAIENFLRDYGYTTSRDKLLSGLSAAFNSEHKVKDGPFNVLKARLGIDPVISKRMMLELDLTGIRQKLLEKIRSLDYRNNEFYVSFISREFPKRLWFFTLTCIFRTRNFA